MPRPSTTCASIRAIMQIQMRRRETVSTGDSTPSCVRASTLFGLTASMNWSTLPYHRKTALLLTRQKRRGRPQCQQLQLHPKGSGLSPTVRAGDSSSKTENGSSGRHISSKHPTVSPLSLQGTVNLNNSSSSSAKGIETSASRVAM
jgi:hypothetical protein